MSHKEIDKLILASEAMKTMRAKYVDIGDLPKPGEVPFKGSFYNEPKSQDVDYYSPTSKERVNRNRNESVLSYLSSPQKKSGIPAINSDQYTAACKLAEVFMKVLPSVTISYGDRVSGGGTQEDSENMRIDGDTQLKNIHDLMDWQYYKICELLVLGDHPVYQIATMMKAMGGPIKLRWSTHYRLKNVQDALDQLSKILPLALKMNRHEIKAYLGDKAA